MAAEVLEERRPEKLASERPPSLYLLHFCFSMHRLSSQPIGRHQRCQGPSDHTK